MAQHMTRRAALLSLPLAFAGVATALARAQTKTASQAKIPIRVYKDPSCGCCTKWVEHMTANGFVASVLAVDMPPIKKQYSVPPRLESCHTTIVGGYVVEGHVPADDVKKLLAAKPAGIIGLTIPGMPQSAPGMDMTPFQPYEVLTFDKDGKTAVYAKHTR
jgi:hypothetical protein